MSSASSERPPPRARRHDPDRRQRILDAALRVIAERGLTGTTHRVIAAAADVPLGSLTYHFSGLDELCQHAFAQHAVRMSGVYRTHFEAVVDGPGLVEAITSLVSGNAGADPDDWAIAFELYLAALRDPALRLLTQGWMDASRATLEQFVDPATARGLDAMIEGLVIHRMLATDPMPDAEVRQLVAKLVTPEGHGSVDAATPDSVAGTERRPS
ncbi:TetR/AcrR family transcriptional regulator [Nocardioides sp. SR21]|uniref:TetR/AcrR family transcriptional regulator n=1 Tax=Nocardioides sp. SR21 TaxID=2919501 RepID=UPI001FA9A0E4|nr:TetR family transcriptional regulator [Nocardioides sp. SR21]